MIYVFYDHRLVGQHPDGTSLELLDGDLLMTEPDGTEVAYPNGTWHGTGDDTENGIKCAFVVPNPLCPRCYREGDYEVIPESGGTVAGFPQLYPRPAGA